MPQVLPPERAVRPAVVTLPTEIDITNAGDVAEELRAAIASGGSTVVADLTATVFCDSSGLRVVLLAHDWATADGVELRLAVSPGPALVILKMLSLDELVPVYPTLDEALAGEPAPDAGAPHGVAVPDVSAG